MSDENFRRFYFEEAPQEAEQMHPTSIRLRTSTLVELDALASFFGTTRSFIIQTILTKQADELSDRVFNETRGSSHDAFVEALKVATYKLQGKEVE